MILLTSNSCAPCKIVKKFIDDNGLQDKVKTIDINTTEGRKLVQDQGVRTVPTMITSFGNVVGQKPILDILEKVRKED